MMKISIDPGRNGAVAVDFGIGDVITYKCPDTQHEMCELIEELKGIADHDRGMKISAVIERVHAMPGQGVTSVWSFSANYATWQTALICFQVPFQEVRPQKWMKEFGMLPKDKKERKHAIKDRMQKQYPQLKVNLINADALGMLSVFDKL
jgi:crossover junction endodeoxyribonuclease RuvC